MALRQLGGPRESMTLYENKCLNCENYSVAKTWGLRGEWGCTLNRPWAPLSRPSGLPRLCCFFAVLGILSAQRWTMFSAAGVGLSIRLCYDSRKRC